MTTTGVGVARIGESIRRIEDERFLTGRGRYVDDISLGGQLTAVFVRSPHAHAEILDINIDEAQSATGVQAVLVSAATYRLAGRLHRTGSATWVIRL